MIALSPKQKAELERLQADSSWLATYVDREGRPFSLHRHHSGKKPYAFNITHDGGFKYGSTETVNLQQFRRDVERGRFKIVAGVIPTPPAQATQLELLPHDGEELR